MRHCASVRPVRFAHHSALACAAVFTMGGGNRGGPRALITVKDSVTYFNDPDTASIFTERLAAALVQSSGDGLTGMFQKKLRTVAEELSSQAAVATITGVNIGTGGTASKVVRPWCKGLSNRIRCETRSSGQAKHDMSAFARVAAAGSEPDTCGSTDAEEAGPLVSPSDTHSSGEEEEAYSASTCHDHHGLDSGGSNSGTDIGATHDCNPSPQKFCLFDGETRHAGVQTTEQAVKGDTPILASMACLWSTVAALQLRMAALEAPDGLTSEGMVQGAVVQTGTEHEEYIIAKDMEVLRLQATLKATEESINNKDKEILKLQASVVASEGSIIDKDKDLLKLQATLKANEESITTRDNEVKDMVAEEKAKRMKVQEDLDKVQELWPEEELKCRSSRQVPQAGAGTGSAGRWLKEMDDVMKSNAQELDEAKDMHKKELDEVMKLNAQVLRDLDEVKDMHKKESEDVKKLNAQVFTGHDEVKDMPKRPSKSIVRKTSCGQLILSQVQEQEQVQEQQGEQVQQVQPAQLLQQLRRNREGGGQFQEQEQIQGGRAQEAEEAKGQRGQGEAEEAKGQRGQGGQGRGRGRASSRRAVAERETVGRKGQKDQEGEEGEKGGGKKREAGRVINTVNARREQTLPKSCEKINCPREVSRTIDLNRQLLTEHQEQEQRQRSKEGTTGVGQGICYEHSFSFQALQSEEQEQEQDPEPVFAEDNDQRVQWLTQMIEKRKSKPGIAEETAKEMHGYFADIGFSWEGFRRDLSAADPKGLKTAVWTLQDIFEKGKDKGQFAVAAGRCSRQVQQAVLQVQQAGG